MPYLINIKKKMTNKVVLWGTSSCIWCAKTREFFKQHKVKFKDIDVGSNIKAAGEMIEKSGQQGVPVIEINKEIIIGYDEDKLKKLLKIK